MDYQWVRDFALKLIGQYSVAGQKISVSYNNQADYLNRIPALVEEGQCYIATTAGKIPVVVPADSLQHTEVGAWIHYTLPEDCWQLCSDGVFCGDDPYLRRYHSYRLMGSHILAVPKERCHALFIEYYRYPKSLGSSPEDTAPLDNTPAAQMVLPYYVAAHLVMYDNAFAYSALYNEFESKLARLRKHPQTELRQIDDVYTTE